MNWARYLRRLFWIGWIAWFFASLILLRQLPTLENLVLWEELSLSSTVNWTSEGNELFVTWSFLIWWAVLILIWPLLLRPIQFTNILKLIFQAIPKLSYDLVISLVFLVILSIWLAGFVLMMIPALVALLAWWGGFVLMMIPALAIVLSAWLILFILHTLLFRWIRPVSIISKGLKILQKSIVWLWHEGLKLLLPLWRFVVQQFKEGILNLLPLWRFIVQYWHGVLSILEPLSGVLSKLGIGNGPVDSRNPTLN